MAKKRLNVSGIEEKLAEDCRANSFNRAVIVDKENAYCPFFTFGVCRYQSNVRTYKADEKKYGCLRRMMF
jgi:hypothetical protein